MLAKRVHLNFFSKLLPSRTIMYTQVVILRRKSKHKRFQVFWGSDFNLIEKNA